MLHVDTGHNFPEVLAFRDATVERLGLRLDVARVQDYIDDGRLRERADGTRNPLQTLPLLDAIAAHRFDAVFGGARRDEDKARAKERIISLRDEFGQWDPRNQRPELWNLYNGRHTVAASTSARSRSSNWTELDVWRYIEREGIELPGAVLRPRARGLRSATACGAPSARSRSRASTRTVVTSARCATAPSATCRCTGAVESPTPRPCATSSSRSPPSTLTERGATRADDRISEAAMEDRKKDGYF